MSALDTSFANLMVKHALTCISISAYSTSFTVWLHWSSGGGGCVNGHGETSTEALVDAIAQMTAERSPELAGELAA